MKVILATVAIVLTLPIIGYAAQAVFTVKNVGIAYEEQIKAIDAEVARLEETIVEPDPKKTWAENFAIEDGHNLAVYNRIEQLKDDKHILDVAYNLVVTSFR